MIEDRYAIRNVKADFSLNFIIGLFSKQISQHCHPILTEVMFYGCNLSLQNLTLKLIEGKFSPLTTVFLLVMVQLRQRLQ